jgi:hypothetical protein
MSHFGRICLFFAKNSPKLGKKPQALAFKPKRLAKKLKTLTFKPQRLG